MNAAISAVKAVSAVAAILKDRFPNLTAKESIEIAGRVVEVVIAAQLDDVREENA